MCNHLVSSATYYVKSPYYVLDHIVGASVAGDT